MSRPDVLVVEHEDDGTLGRLEPVLRGVAELHVLRPDLGDPVPADLAGYGGLIVLGGTMGATDDDAAPWLPATRRLLACGVETGTATLGICLGAQLLAVATGGRVERGAAGLEVGVVPVTLLPAARHDPLLGPLADSAGSGVPGADAATSGGVTLVPQYHQDAVTELPPGAVPLAAGERYPHQAFRLGERAWGLQYHPEVTASDFAAWLGDGHGALAAAGWHAPDLAAAYTAAEPRLAALAHVHATAFAAVLTSAPVRAS